jgi:hypothetical protein
MGAVHVPWTAIQDRERVVHERWEIIASPFFRSCSVPSRTNICVTNNLCVPILPIQPIQLVRMNVGLLWSSSNARPCPMTSSMFVLIREQAFDLVTPIRPVIETCTHLASSWPPISKMTHGSENNVKVEAQIMTWMQRMQRMQGMQGM